MEQGVTGSHSSRQHVLASRCDRQFRQLFLFLNHSYFRVPLLGPCLVPKAELQSLRRSSFRLLSQRFAVPTEQRLAPAQRRLSFIPPMCPARRVLTAATSGDSLQSGMVPLVAGPSRTPKGNIV